MQKVRNIKYNQILIIMTANNNIQFHSFPCGTQFAIDQKKNLNLEGGTPIYSTKFLN